MMDKELRVFNCISLLLVIIMFFLVFIFSPTPLDPIYIQLYCLQFITAAVNIIIIISATVNLRPYDYNKSHYEVLEERKNREVLKNARNNEKI